MLITMPDLFDHRLDRKTTEARLDTIDGVVDPDGEAIMTWTQQMGGDVEEVEDGATFRLARGGHQSLAFEQGAGVLH